MDLVLSDTKIMKRRLKSLTERILFIDSILVYSTPHIVESVKCKILGSRNILYDLTIWKDNDSNIHCNCSCPDNSLRKNNCKHIYWFGYQKFGFMDTQFWTEELYNDFIYKNWLIDYSNTSREKNKDCPICLETINYDKETTIRCRTQCNNSVHAVCWNRYRYISGKLQCVFCRNEMSNTIL